MEEQELTEKISEQSSEVSKPEKLLELRFYIPFEDYLCFHQQIIKEQSDKVRRRAIILGSIELAAGLAFLVTWFASKTQKSTLTWFAAVLLVFFGGFQILHYVFLYEKTLTRALRYQYEHTPYLKEEIHLDFYPDKIVEHLCEGEQTTYWHTFYEIQENERFLMLMPEKNRCMLIPKLQIKEQWTQLDALVGEICKNYEKERRQI